MSKKHKHAPINLSEMRIIYDCKDYHGSFLDIRRKYEVTLNDMYKCLYRAVIYNIMPRNQYHIIVDKIKEEIKAKQETLARSVEEETIRFYESGGYKVGNHLRTNTELAKIFGLDVNGAPMSKKYISNILIEYMPEDLRLLRHDELKEQSKHVILFKTPEENKANGKKGAEKTNKLLGRGLLDKL
jgi:DNA-binding XRE family transcriptional regulator